MRVEQVYSIANTVFKEVLGESAVVYEDLSNIASLGETIFNTNAVDNYVQALVNVIGKQLFVDRKFTGILTKLWRDSWEFGSVMQKVDVDIPEADVNEAWELQDGTSYDQQIFYKPNVTAKFFNSKVTFEVNRSFTRKQVKESMTNATALEQFYSMIMTSIENAMIIRKDWLSRRLLNILIAETVYDDFDAASITDYGSASGVKAVNLLYLYNELHPTATLTVAECRTSPEFLRFMSFTIGKYVKRLKDPSTLFNVGGKVRFTDPERLNIVMLNTFKQASEVYLRSSTYWNDLVALPNGIDEVSFWQGSGTTYSDEAIEEINLKTPNNNTVNVDGVVCVMYDTYAAMACNESREVETVYNKKGKFYTHFSTWENSYFVDTDENCVVFFVA